MSLLEFSGGQYGISDINAHMLVSPASQLQMSAEPKRLNCVDGAYLLVVEL